MSKFNVMDIQGSESMIKKNKKDPGKACPLLKKNVPDCASSQVSSRTADDALKYCVGHFQECPIYQAHC